MKGSNAACKENFGGPDRTQSRKLRTKAFCLLTPALMGDPFSPMDLMDGVDRMDLVDPPSHDLYKI
jgi:hypothetical protein